MNNNQPEFSKLEKQLGVEFKDKDLLKQAFCHRSYINENPNFSLGHNERLEFLGDAVLELAVTDYLFEEYPDTPEGNLTSWRAALVNSESLSKTAKKLNFEDYLLLSKGEQKEQGKGKDYILADTFEAFLGALYLDRGYKKAEKIVKENIICNLEEVLENNEWQDSKSYFQEKAQKKVGVTPSYKCLKKWGPDHAKHFKIGVFLKDKKVTEGEGSSKQEAEEDAAEKGLKVKGWK